MAKTTKGSIPVPHSLATQHVKFSFRHLDTENPKYSLQKCCVEFFSRLVRALARYSSFTVEEFRNQDNKDGRHSHYFPHTSEPDGFTCLNDPEGLEMEEPWQIKLCPEIQVVGQFEILAARVDFGSIFESSSTISSTLHT